MKNLIISFLLAICLFGCHDCRNSDCPGNAEFAFKVLDSSGRSIFGSTRFTEIIQNDSIKIIALGNANSETEITLLQEETTLFFRPEPGYMNYLIQYSFAPDDNLIFDLTTYTDKCCLNTVTDYQVQINSNGNFIAHESDSIFVFTK